MKRPAFQFYVGDWLRNAKLRRCSPAARGAWIDVLCLLHDADEYGILRWPLADIAQAAGVPIKLLRELVEKGVLKGADKGCEPYIYRPRHAGQEGDPVVLVPESDGSCWYCSRFVRDEYVRQRRGNNTRFDADNQQPNRKPKPEPKPPFGVRQGDGASTATAVDQNQSLRSERSTGIPSTSGRAGPLCARVRRESGLVQVNPGDPRLQAAFDAGVTDDEIVSACADAAQAGKGWAYALSTAVGRHRDAQTLGENHAITTGRPRSLSAPERVAAAIAERDRNAGGRTIEHPAA